MYYFAKVYYREVCEPERDRPVVGVHAMGSGPIRGSSKSREQPALPPWVKSVERTSHQTGSQLSLGAPELAAVRAPIRTEPRPNRPAAMAEKDSSVFQNASHVFVVFGASVS